MYRGAVGICGSDGASAHFKLEVRSELAPGRASLSVSPSNSTVTRSVAGPVKSRNTPAMCPSLAANRTASPGGMICTPLKAFTSRSSLANADNRHTSEASHDASTCLPGTPGSSPNELVTMSVRKMTAAASGASVGSAVITAQKSVPPPPLGCSLTSSPRVNPSIPCTPVSV